MFTLAFHSQTESGYELLAEFGIGFDNIINNVSDIILKFHLNVYSDR
jgi:hypothetical protein